MHGGFATKLLPMRACELFWDWHDSKRDLQNPHFLFGKVEGEHWGSQCPFSSQLSLQLSVSPEAFFSQCVFLFLSPAKPQALIEAVNSLMLVVGLALAV